jgi:predicted alpha/beta hydrolase
VEISTPDGISLRGQLWAGSDVGVLVVGAYGAVEGELDPIIEPLAARGFMVLTHDLRGDGASGGRVQPELLGEDLAVAIGFLRNRIDRVYVVAYRHAGAAALTAAGAGRLDVDGLAGVFAMERYLEQDALSALPEIEVPLLLIGATNSMAAAAPDGTVFGSVGSGPEIFTRSGGIIASQVAQFIADTGN